MCHRRPGTRKRKIKSGSHADSDIFSSNEENFSEGSDVDCDEDEWSDCNLDDIEIADNDLLMFS